MEQSHREKKIMVGKVWKYMIQVTDGIQRVEMPVGARVIHGSLVDQEIAIWVEIDMQELRTTYRSFRVYGTGSYIKTGTHVQTVVSEGVSPYVWHVYEI